jgi:hypothetical protein
MPPATNTAALQIKNIQGGVVHSFILRLSFVAHMVFIHGPLPRAVALQEKEPRCEEKLAAGSFAREGAS